ncbi:hypothetical protein HMSSN036_87890 [Paenibacillus macerans]|nr:hypothetical protein HMSSN036_87890 [Paenibacillus macerans]
MEDLAGRIWILDPIDGTMNFIKQKENFAVMIAVVEDGIGKCGFIYDVMRSRLVWGGPKPAYIITVNHCRHCRITN